MKHFFNSIAFTALLAIGSTCCAGQRSPITPADMLHHTFKVGTNSFLLDGQPFVYHAAEIHPNRIPPAYWRHRLQMVKAMGLNTVSIYLFWNQIEPEPGEFNWTGICDAAKFCRLAQEEGLWVILRPGPYVCAEWEMGGLPWWLLKNKDIKLRSLDPRYMKAARRYIKEVGRELGPLQITHGGPIILCQVENEFPYKDQPYLAAMRQVFLDAGFDVPLTACNPTKGGQRFVDSYRDDLLQTVNFGAGKAEESFDILKKFKKTGPYANAEYYVAGFDFWGEKHITSNVEGRLKDLEYMLTNGYSFCFYMGCGGTSFGFTAGAYTARETAEYPNDSGADAYRPDTTSYDFDAPISESGAATKKFYTLREFFSKHLQPGETLPDVPKSIPVISVPTFALNEVSPVTATSVAPVHDEVPKTMEAYGQGYGIILYRITLPPGPAGELTAQSVHDFAYILLDGVRQGIMDRRRRLYSVALPARHRPVTLDVIVEAMGRANWGIQMIDHKGLHAPVTLRVGDESHALTGWQVYPMSLDTDELASLKFTNTKSMAPAFLRGCFEIKQVGDTFLDTRQLGKGMLWVNGHNLGRYWNIGPQQTLYCPGCWLKPGRNEVIALEFLGASAPTLTGLNEPILNQLRSNLDFSTKKTKKE